MERTERFLRKGTMYIPRSSGIILHPTSLPGPYGIGDLGPEAFGFVDVLASNGQSWWQFLPVGPTGAGNSPYQSPSSHAGNPLLISPRVLLDEGLLVASDFDDFPSFSSDHVDYTAVSLAKRRLHQRAFRRFGHGDPAYLQFEREQGGWLEDYALFAAIDEEQEGRPWFEWDQDLALRRPEALCLARERLTERGLIPFFKFEQFLFERQWQRLRERCRARNIRLIGDLPIYVAPNSSEVWARPELFCVDETGRSTHVAGVPPDFFNADGQHWGNPLYRWEAHRAEGYAWWIGRLSAVLRRVDLVRLDHFRGFQAYWEVPAGDATAVHGRWADGPDVNPEAPPFLSRLHEHFVGLPLIAEDLGYITPEVHALRDRFRLPGMKVLQFAFGGGPDHAYLPHNYQPRCIACTGTHDTDTTVGWFRGLEESSPRERAALLRYTGTDGREIHWDVIRLALGSVAEMAIVPLQDVLGMDSSCRMNIPGVATGNWTWRLGEGQLDPAALRRLSDMTWTFGRWNPGSARS